MSVSNVQLSVSLRVLLIRGTTLSVPQRLRFPLQFEVGEGEAVPGLPK